MHNLLKNLGSIKHSSVQRFFTARSKFVRRRRCDLLHKKFGSELERRPATCPYFTARQPLRVCKYYKLFQEILNFYGNKNKIIFDRKKLIQTLLRFAKITLKMPKESHTASSQVSSDCFAKLDFPRFSLHN